MEILLVLLVLIAYFLIGRSIVGAKDMQSLGLILILLGLFFGWPLAAIGAALVIAHYYKDKK